MCVKIILYLEEKETPKTTRKLTIEREELGYSDLADERIIGIKATCNSKQIRKIWWRKFQSGLVLLFSAFTQHYKKS
jgi:hypothetical protein